MCILASVSFCCFFFRLKYALSFSLSRSLAHFQTTFALLLTISTNICCIFGSLQIHFIIKIGAQCFQSNIEIRIVNGLKARVCTMYIVHCTFTHIMVSWLLFIPSLFISSIQSLSSISITLGFIRSPIVITKFSSKIIVFVCFWFSITNASLILVVCTYNVRLFFAS